MNTNYLISIDKQFRYYKLLGEQTMAQLSDEQLLWQFNAESNSIAIIVKHISGNMLSRWTDFLTSDGEKEWRNRESEFEGDLNTREKIMNHWDKAWDVLFDALAPLEEKDMGSIVYIRNQGHTITEAINRQLAHYAYHIGQMVFLGKMQKGEDWKSLSIPRGKSADYNAQKFSKEKERGHFTDEFLGDKK